MLRENTSLTEGSVWKGILLFTLPLLTANLFQQFYNAFDSWAVGKFLGETALAAVSSSGNLIYMMIGFFNGVAMGAGVIIAKFFGARDYPAMNRAIHTDIAFGLASGAFLTVFGVLFTPTILAWMQTPAEVMPESVAYFRWYSWGIGFAVMYNILVGILHAVGDSKHPLYYLIFSTFVNVILDLLFVAVLGLGVGSAAIATTVSQGVSALLCFLHLIRDKDLPYRLNWRKIGFTGKLWRTLSALVCPLVCRIRSSAWPMWWCRAISMPLAQRLWLAAVQMPKLRDLPCCPSSALPRR